MAAPSERRLSLLVFALVFALVGADLTTLHLTRPVLPVLRAEFGVDGGRASLTVSAMVFGMALALALICAGFFTVHAAAAGALNHRLDAGRGRANACCVLVYYLGGFAGITASGYAWQRAGRPGVVTVAARVLAVPLSTGFAELRAVRS